MKYIRRAGYAAIAIVATLPLLLCFLTAVAVPSRCGIENDAAVAIPIVELMFPAAVIVAIIAAVSGWFFSRWTLIVQAALIVLCLAFVGIFQAIPHYDYPPGSPHCQIDL